MTDKNKNILISIDWFLPAYKAGGPIQSVHNIVEQLSHKFKFYIVTSNCDIDGVLDIPNTILNKWTRKENYQIIYLDKAHQNKKIFKQLFGERNYAAIYFNSLFSKNFTLLPLRLLQKDDTKIILAPRGMLGKGALSIKPFKKKIFLQVFKLLGWHKKVTWHATADSEKQEILRNFGLNLKIHVASNLSKKPKDNVIAKEKRVNELLLFFLSRISYKKNLLTAIKILKHVNKKFRVRFTIIGPIEDKNYWELCIEAIERLPQNIEIVVVGPQPNLSLQDILQNQHVLLLPTRHENFGHVIVESWQSGCPVIISDQTPWQNLEKKQVGFALSLNNEKIYTKYIEFFAAMNQSQFHAWSKSSHNKSLNIAYNPNILVKYMKLFSNSKK